MSERNVEFDSIRFTSEIICGAGDAWRRLEPGHYAFTIPPDPDWPGYDYFFCVRLTNYSNDIRKIKLEARRPGRESNQPLWQASRVPLFIGEDFHSWYVLDQVESVPDHEEFRATLTLAPAQTVFLTNSLPCLSEWMENWLEQIATQTPDLAILHRIGESAQGRDILLLSITDPAVDAANKDRVLVTSGLHPAEPDWLATKEIIGALIEDSDWARQIRRNFIIDIVSQANPDGFDLGKNACNAHGINLYWDFRPQDMATSPEAVYLWRWLEAHPPTLYIDFHAYVYQLHKDFRPYIRPGADYAPEARPVVRAMDAALIDLCDGRRVVDSATSEPRTPAAQMTAAFGTITYPKFHMHLNHGVPACRRLGLDVFQVVVEKALLYRPLFPKTVGAARRQTWSDPLLRWWKQGRVPVKARRGWARMGRILGFSRRVQAAVPQSEEPGLPKHWQRHLWSQRERAQPVITIQ